MQAHCIKCTDLYIACGVPIYTIASVGRVTNQKAGGCFAPQHFDPLSDWLVFLITFLKQIVFWVTHWLADKAG